MKPHTRDMSLVTSTANFQPDFFVTSRRQSSSKTLLDNARVWRTTSAILASRFGSLGEIFRISVTFSLVGVGHASLSAPCSAGDVSGSAVDALPMDRAFSKHAPSGFCNSNW
eukprot:CAMPEP_0117501740 /NCGR_PEP_ID=MMETSP0784-20121206/23455_1 /TAXON_ID=39447 /ORGANISM="" /LENGTH=111 /DNA_ID=CAMNT_0005297005 /DNA_START=307 /DNA_END=642 /DNA_ORIENTATION=-